MSIKLILENWRRFVTEEEQPQTNYQKVLAFLQSKGLDITEKAPSTLVIKSDNREETKRAIEQELEDNFGFIFMENAPGSSFGRFELQDRVGGNVYILLKPKKAGAAGVGLDYEKRMSQTIANLLPDFEVKTAGFGAGSDLSIFGNGKELKMELKTSSGADFGQFKLSYNLQNGSWHTIKTTKFIENQDLFQGIFDSTIAPNLEGKVFSVNQDPAYDIRGDLVVGLVRSPTTEATKKRLQKELFGNKSDLNFKIDARQIQHYYALKGDSLISVEGKGVYALTAEASRAFNIYELSDMIKSSWVRFRIKPQMGANSAHTFACALKILLEPSSEKITDSYFLDSIKDYMS